jgi:bifunctional UDP-N-acetylglucosamine pyrophosphorylase/glucosamine-1-phosphate N-acetyltransferase
MTTPTSQRLEVVILAAGKGTRMRSALPKVLHRLAGQPLVEHVIHTAQQLGADSIHVVYGYGGEQVPDTLRRLPVRWARQEPQLGTGHAVQQAMPAVTGDIVLVLYGDVPLTRLDTLRPLVEAAAGGSLAVLTAMLKDPTGYGRIVRDPSGRVVRIVEQKDASAAEKAICEVNTGIMAAPAEKMRAWLAHLRNENAQSEYYLTDILGMAVNEGETVTLAQPMHEWEILGVNSKKQLSELERIHQRNQAERLMEEGVTLLDPARLDVRGTLTCGADVTIDVNVVIEGNVTLGHRVKIGPNNVLRNCSIGDDTEIHPNCVIEDSVIGNQCRVGPFARMRPTNRIADHVHIGNFVEVKNSEIHDGSKMNHLSYIGDTTVGRKVNIGAGTIVCNYDGANKHHTNIGDNAFIGSNSALVAPITIGDGATIGAGSVISKDAPPGELTVARTKQVTISGWTRPQKKPKGEVK